MKRIKCHKTLGQPVAVLIVAGGLITSLVAIRVGAEPTATASLQTNVVTTPPISAKTPPAPIRHQIPGAELYAIHCNRCHPERYPTERTAAQWRTIMLHMRVRANIPGQQARLILKYLQEDSGR